MPKFTVVQYRNACVRYEVDLEAETPEAALEIAKTSDCKWSTGNISEYDDAEMEICDENGVELIAAHEV